MVEAARLEKSPKSWESSKWAVRCYSTPAWRQSVHFSLQRTSLTESFFWMSCQRRTSTQWNSRNSHARMPPIFTCIPQDFPHQKVVYGACMKVHALCCTQRLCALFCR